MRKFLRLVLQPVLPKGLRRTRCWGFLHPNASRLAALLKLLVFKVPQPRPEAKAERATLRCGCCGATMRIIRTRAPPSRLTSAAAVRPTAAAPPPNPGGATDAQA